jgi:hypothetical protein
MKVNELATRQELISTPLPLWEDSYTAIPNAEIFKKIDENIRGGGLKVKNEEYRVSRTQSGIIKGVIGAIDITTPNDEFGQRLMFRNSYDKSMSFAVAIGGVVFICSNGMVRSDNFEYKRVHKGDADSESLLNIDAGFQAIDKEFNIITEQMGNLKECHVNKELMHELVGNLFFEQGAISSVQLNIVKDQMWHSDKFRHIDDKDFSAYDMYNHITESLKRSHPLCYIQNHVTVHKLFEDTFLKQSEPMIIDTPVLEEI